MLEAVGKHTTSTSRRSLLAKAAILAPVAAILTTGASAVAVSKRHPDAPLLAAWSGYVKAHRDFDYAYEVLLPNGGTDKDHEPYWRAIKAFEEQIEKH